MTGDSPGAEQPLLDLAARLTRESSAAMIDGIISQLAAAELCEIADRRVLNEVKKQTRMPLSALAGRLSEAKRALRPPAPDDGGEAGGGRRLRIADVEPWPEPVHGAALLDEMSATIRQYIIVSVFQAAAIALWVVFTHCFNAFDFSPKIVIRSAVMRSGKTRLVQVLERMVRKALLASGISAAALLRVIDQYSPTMLLDEIDTMLKGGDAEMQEALRGLINSGFDRRGARFIKNVPIPGGGYEPGEFSTWCPMLLAGIGKVPNTVADRSISIEMKRKCHDEKVKPLRADDGPELWDLGRRAARWAADNLDDLRRARPTSPEQLHDRAADAWSPLFAIADRAGGEWPIRARHIAAELSMVGADDESVKVLLLEDIRTVFATKNCDRLASEDVVAYLQTLDERPWPEWKGGKPISKAQVAGLLRGFHISPGSIRLADGKTPKGYRLTQFQDAFARYLPSQNATPPQARESAAFGDFQTATSPEGVAFLKPEKPSNSAACGVVADKNPPSRDFFSEKWENTL
jgi:hypothetical protein